MNDSDLYPGEEIFLQANTLFIQANYSAAVPLFEQSSLEKYPPAFLRLGRIFRDADMGNRHFYF